MGQFTKFLVSAAEGPAGAPVRFATRLAAASGASVALTDVMESVPRQLIKQLPEGWDVPRLVRERKEATLERAAAGMRRAGLRPRVSLLEGDPIAAVVDEVERGRYDLYVADAPSGNSVDAGRATAARLVRQCPCPVLLVHDLPRRRGGRVAVAIDPTPWRNRDADALATRIIEAGAWLAEQMNAELHVVHVWDSYGEQQLRRAGATPGEVGDYRLRIRREATRHVQEALEPFADLVSADRVHLERGDPRHALPEFAATQQIDVLVIGTVARSGVARLVLGNTAEMVLGNLTCSMLVVRPERGGARRSRG